jgi:hypothetical protein
VLGIGDGAAARPGRDGHPLFGLPMARQRKPAVTQLTGPAVHLDFHQISSRAKPVRGRGGVHRVSKSFVSRWAGGRGGGFDGAQVPHVLPLIGRLEDELGCPMQPDRPAGPSLEDGHDRDLLAIRALAMIVPLEGVIRG